MFKTLTVPFVAVALTACAGLVTVDDETHPHSVIPVGSTITLNQPIEIPRERARMFIQDGRVSVLGGVNQYEPHCSFRISHHLSDGTARIDPGSFLVTRIRRDTVDIVRQGAPVFLASARWITGASDSSGGPPAIAMVVHYDLHSDTQPNVRRFSCHGGFDDRPNAEPPSVAQIRRTVGAVMTLP